MSDRLSSFYGNIRSHLLGGVLAGRRSVYEVSDADIAEGEDGLTAFRQETDGKEGKKNVIHLKRSSTGRTERIHLDVLKLMDCAYYWRYGMDAYISVQLIIYLLFMSLNAIILTLFIQFYFLFSICLVYPFHPSLVNDCHRKCVSLKPKRLRFVFYARA